jgi:hypothetical protein
VLLEGLGSSKALKDLIGTLSYIQGHENAGTVVCVLRVLSVGRVA